METELGVELERGGSEGITGGMEGPTLATGLGFSVSMGQKEINCSDMGQTSKRW